MSKTISMTGNPPDLDGGLATGVESLEQRIHQAFKFRLGEWFLRKDQGVDYDLIFSHHINFTQVAQVLTTIIEDTGGDEVLNVNDVFYEYDSNTRRFVFSCNLDTIYGTLSFREDF